MSNNWELPNSLLPFVLKQIKGASNQYCSLEGTWKINTNAGSEIFQSHIKSFLAQFGSSLKLLWEVSSTLEKNSLNYRSDLGYFVPRSPLYLLLNSESLKINPQLIISKIKWINPWNIHDFRSTDEYHLIIGRFIQISSRTERGLFYGFQTLLQLLRSTNNNIPYQTIQDAPKHGIRAINIDWMTPSLKPSFIQEILAIAGEYKINAVQISGVEHLPSKQFEVEFAKNYISFGQTLKNTLENTGEKMEFYDFHASGISSLLKIGLYPVISFEILWQACNYWEGRNCPEASFIPRYWRSFLFDYLSESNFNSMTEPKFPIAVSNVLKFFSKIPTDNQKKPLGIFLTVQNDNLRAQLRVQSEERKMLKQFLDFSVKEANEQSIRHPLYWNTFLILVELIDEINQIINLQQQHQETLQLLSQTDSDDAVENLSPTKLKELAPFLDDLLRILNRLEQIISQQKSWFLISKLDEKDEKDLDIFEIKENIKIVEQMSIALQGYLQYHTKLIQNFKQFQEILK
ncbi:MAG: glycoside hydrolase family 20 zincin-like fold domain-containing protein [Promethearchaeota archaeon]